MSRASYLLVVAFALASTWNTAVLAADDDEKIIGVWERETGKDKDLMEETWVVKKTKDKWTVSGTIHNLGEEVGNFKGRDVKFKDGELSFTQDFFKLPKGFATGSKITVEAEGDRLDVAATKDKEEKKYNMTRAGDGSELIGNWKGPGFVKGHEAFWTVEKGKKGELSIRGTMTDAKTGKEIFSWKGVNVRYFTRELMFNQQLEKAPSEKVANGVAYACVGRGGELLFVYATPRGVRGTGKLAKDTK